MRIFIGLDCDEDRLTMAFIGSTGLLKALSYSRSPLRSQIPDFGRIVAGMVRGMCGGENLRVKNILGVGLGLPQDNLKEFGMDIEDQLTRSLKIPVYVQDRDLLRASGELWLKDCSGMIDTRMNCMDLDLMGVYGAAKLVIDKIL